jgi:hypothetical protein
MLTQDYASAKHFNNQPETEKEPKFVSAEANKLYGSPEGQEAAVKRALDRVLKNKPIIERRSNFVYDVESSKRDSRFYQVTLATSFNVWEANCECEGHKRELLCFHVLAATLEAAYLKEHGRLETCADHPSRLAVEDGLCQDCVNDREEIRVEGFTGTKPRTAVAAPAPRPRCKDCGKEVDLVDSDGYCVDCNNLMLCGC